MRRPRCSVLCAVTALFAMAGWSPVARAESSPVRWCAPELETVSEATCYFSAGPQKARTLVIFLHPLVGAGSNWQWDQQRLFARLAEASGFSVLMPRGRLGIGPKR